MSEEQKPDNPIKTKEELFKENPDIFVDLNETIVAVTNLEGKMMLFINPNKKRSDITRALGELQVAITREMIFSDIAKANSNKIQPASGGIINFVKNLKR